MALDVAIQALKQKKFQLEAELEEFKEETSRYNSQLIRISHELKGAEEKMAAHQGRVKLRRDDLTQINRAIKALEKEEANDLD